MGACVLTGFIFLSDRGARYDFYLSGKNGLGWGQEAYAYLDTPEGGIYFLLYLFIVLHLSVIFWNSFFKISQFVARI